MITGNKHNICNFGTNFFLRHFNLTGDKITISRNMACTHIIIYLLKACSHYSMTERDKWRFSGTAQYELIESAIEININRSY